MDPTLFAAGFYLLAIVIEQRVLRRHRNQGMPRRDYEWRDGWTSVLSGVVAPLAWIPINLTTYAAASVLWDYRLFDLGTGFWTWALILIGWDFSFYWQHRLEHEVRLFWGGHVTHHSSRYFNYSTALRQSWTPWTGPLIYSWWALVGVRPEMIFIAGGWNLFYQFWLHTETVGRLPAWMEAWLNTPSHHRVHHGTNPRYLDKNYAGALIIWDRLFGTFEPESEPVTYGLTKNVGSFNLFWVQLHEYVAMLRDCRRAGSWRDRLWWTFASPAAVSQQRTTSAMSAER
jgi:sterol desaturase/sphingolipid hydroxylase (fatty acid hydroxylase superfamily)